MHRSAYMGSHLKSIIITISILLASAAIGFLFDALGMIEINIYTVYILGILITAVFTASRFYATISSVFSILMFNFLFAEPRFSFEAVNFGYPLDFVIVLCVSLLVSSLAFRSERMAFRTKTLLATDQLFLQASGTEQIVSITAQQLIQLLARPLVFRMADNNRLAPPQYYGNGAPGNEWDNDAALWTYAHGESSGARTGRFSRAEYQYVAIRTADQTLGVMGVAAGKRAMTDMEQNLLHSLLSECALTLERDFYNQKRQETAVQMRHEKLRADLLRSISHDLRTPLTAISGNANLLSEQNELLSNEQKQKLTSDICDDAQWLLGTVENLLSVTRIEDGRMAIQLRPEMMCEIIPEAVSHISKHGCEHNILIEQEDDMLMAHIDARLIMQVIINLVDNAVKYTPRGSTIIVRTLKRNDKIAVEVVDNGPGIPNESKKRIFEMFYTTSAGSIDGRRGLGLGLALCKAIIDAHGGELDVRDNTPQGAIFTFTIQEERID